MAKATKKLVSLAVPAQAAIPEVSEIVLNLKQAEAQAVYHWANGSDSEKYADMASFSDAKNAIYVALKALGFTQRNR